MDHNREADMGGFLFSTDKRKLDVQYIHRFLSGSYWAPAIPVAVVRTSIENSLAVGVYDAGRQIGFARVITDFATFGYLADVFIDEAYRGRGLSKNLMTFIFSLPFVGDLRRFLLATRDAHGLYRKSGFRELGYPDRFMEINQPDIYLRKQ